MKNQVFGFLGKSTLRRLIGTPLSQTQKLLLRMNKMQYIDTEKNLVFVKLCSTTVYNYLGCITQIEKVGAAQIRIL